MPEEILKCPKCGSNQVALHYYEFYEAKIDGNNYEEYMCGKCAFGWAWVHRDSDIKIADVDMPVFRDGEQIPF